MRSSKVWTASISSGRAVPASYASVVRKQWQPEFCRSSLKNSRSFALTPACMSPTPTPWVHNSINCVNARSTCYWVRCQGHSLQTTWSRNTCSMIISWLSPGISSQSARRRRILFDDLREARWVLAPSDSVPGRMRTDVFAAGGLPIPKGALYCLSIHLTIALVANGRSVAFLPSSVIQFNPGRQALKVLSLKLPQYRVAVGIVTVKNRTMNPLAQHFIACAQRIAAPLAKDRWCARHQARWAAYTWSKLVTGMHCTKYRSSTSPTGHLGRFGDVSSTLRSYPDSRHSLALRQVTWWANHVDFASRKIGCRKARDRSSTTPKPSDRKWHALCVRCCQKCLLWLFSGSEDGNRSAVCCWRRAERCHSLGELCGRTAGGSAASRRIGGNAVNHPGCADRTHRRTDKGVLAGMVNSKAPAAFCISISSWPEMPSWPKPTTWKLLPIAPTSVPLSELVEGW